MPGAAYWLRLPVDVLTVCEELDRAGELEEAGGTAYVHSLPNLVPAAGNARIRVAPDRAWPRPRSLAYLPGTPRSLRPWQARSSLANSQRNYAGKD